MESSKLKVRCTYPECNKHFETEKDMKYHKKYDASHNYCKRCDVDCLDWEDLTQHKVEKMQPWLDGKMRDNKDESPAHIVCEFCGEDFKSFGGRKKHRDTYHQAEQTIICPGCGDIFVQASHLIEHFEKDKCTEISCRRYIGYVTHKHVIKQILQNPEEFGQGCHVNHRFAPASETLESGYADGDGGVAILDIEDDTQKGGHQPLVPEANLFTEHYETSPTMRNLERELEKSHISRPSAWTTGATVPALFPNAKPTPPAAGDWGRILDWRESEILNANNNSTNVFKTRCWDPTSEEYNIDRFFHSLIQKYCCPFPSCESQYDGHHDLEVHMNYGHLMTNFVCPACLKRFKKGSSLIAHAEAAGGKCRFKERTDFDKALDLVSGGFLTSESIRQPKVYKTDPTAVTTAGAGAKGVMSTKFEAKMPEEKK